MADKSKKPNKPIAKKLALLNNKLQELEVKRAARKQSKKDPIRAALMKLRRQLIAAIEVFESDKDKVPLEILSLSKRLVFAINQVEEQAAADKEAAAQVDSGEPETPEIVF